MQVPSRFSIALHMLSCMIYFKDSYKITSNFLSGSTNTNPVLIRNILKQLQKAGIIETKRGEGGSYIKKKLEKVSFLDIFKATECIEGNKLFSFHPNPNQKCPVGCNIHNILDDMLDEIEQSLEKKLQEITLKDIEKNLNKYCP